MLACYASRPIPFKIVFQRIWFACTFKRYFTNFIEEIFYFFNYAVILFNPILKVIPSIFCTFKIHEGANYNLYFFVFPSFNWLIDSCSRFLFVAVESKWPVSFSELYAFMVKITTASSSNALETIITSEDLETSSRYFLCYFSTGLWKQLA